MSPHVPRFVSLIVPTRPFLSPQGAAAVASLPEAAFDAARHQLTLRGDSCPDNAVAFYGPLIARLRAHLDRCRGQLFRIDVALGACDIASARMLFALFDTLNEAALTGNTIAVRWQRGSLKFRDELAGRFPLLQFGELPQNA